MTITPTEITGYLASALILISFVMNNMRTLRIVNTVGCAMFVAYGILLEYSWPVIITNAAIIGINCFYLLREKK